MFAGPDAAPGGFVCKFRSLAEPVFQLAPLRPLKGERNMSDVERYNQERKSCLVARKDYLELVHKLEIQVQSLLAVDDVQITDNRMVGMNSQTESKCVVEAREWPNIDKIITHLKKFNDLRKKHRSTYETLDYSVRGDVERPV
jgi:hypothetical protein